jgi:hypothetical protein
LPVAISVEDGASKTTAVTPAVTCFCGDVEPVLKKSPNEYEGVPDDALLSHVDDLR